MATIAGTIQGAPVTTESLTLVSLSGTQTPSTVVADGSGNVYCNGAQVGSTLVGKPTSINGVTLSGTGFPLIVASAQTGSISTTQTNLINYTPPSAIGTYRMTITVSNTSATNTGSLTPSIGYATQGGQTTFAPNFMQNSSATLLTATTTASKDFTSTSTFTITSAATAITLTMTVSGTVAAYISAVLEQLI